jgi:hypothetical protein
MFRGLVWLVFSLALAGCGGSAGDGLGTVGGTAGAGAGSVAGSSAITAGAGGTESAADAAGASQGGEPGAAAGTSDVAHQGGQADVAGASGTSGAAGTSAGVGGGAEAGGQSGAAGGGSTSAGASMGGASGQGGSAAAGTSGGGIGGGSESAGAGGAATCECSVGQCCDGCYFRPGSYKLGMAIFRTGCAGPGGSVLAVETRPLNCTGASSTDVMWGNYNDDETTSTVCPLGNCIAPCLASNTCGQGYPPKATPDPSLLAYCQ